jgi:prepilin-type N-terminal cleavage/methylation domain-containing protein
VARCRNIGRLREESGFSLVELLMSMMLLSLGVMALMGTFDHSRKTTTTAEAQGAAVQVAERHLERLSALPYGEIAHTSTPPSSLDPGNPGYWVENSSPAGFRWDPPGPSSAPLIVSAGGNVPNDLGTWGLDAGETSADSRMSGKAYAYVTWVNDPCASCNATDQTITNDYKRITVAVTADAPSPLTKPVMVSTIVTNPDAIRSS